MCVCSCSTERLQLEAPCPPPTLSALIFHPYFRTSIYLSQLPPIPPSFLEFSLHSCLVRSRILCSSFPPSAQCSCTIFLSSISLICCVPKLTTPFCSSSVHSSARLPLTSSVRLVLLHWSWISATTPPQPLSPSPPPPRGSPQLSDYLDTRYLSIKVRVLNIHLPVSLESNLSTNRATVI